MGLSYGKAEARIIIRLMRRPTRAILSAQPLNHLCLAYIKKVNQSHYRPEVSRGFQGVNVPRYVTMAQDGGKVISFTHRPLLPLGNTPGTHFC